MKQFQPIVQKLQKSNAKLVSSFSKNRFIKYFIVILLFISQALVGQTILAKIDIEQDQGLHQRNIAKVIRDNAGYFYFFGKDAIQRFDGKSFEYIDHEPLKADKVFPDQIDHLHILENGQILISINTEQKHYVLNPSSKKIQAIDLGLSAFPWQGSVFSTRKTGEAFETSQYAIDQNTTAKAISEPIKSSFIPIQVVPHSDGYFLTKPDSSIILQQENAALDLPEKGLLIERESTIYLWTNKAIYTVDGNNLNLVTLLPQEIKKQLTILKNDAAGNIIAAYASRIRFNEHLYTLDQDNKLISLDNIVTRTRGLFRDFYTDDAAYKWMFAGYNAATVVNLLRDGSEIIFHRPGMNKNMFGNVMSGVAADKKDVYFLKEGTGFYRVNSDNPRGFEDVFPNADYTSSFFNNGKLYFSEEDEVFYSYAYRYDGTSVLTRSDVKRGRWENFSVPFKVNDLLPVGDNKVMVVGFDKENRNGVIRVFDCRTKEYENISTPNLNLIRSIYFYPTTGTYWVGTQRGLHVLDTTYAEVAVFNNSDEDNGDRYIENQDVIMVNGFNGKLIVGSLGGAYVINPTTYKVEKQLSEFDALTNGKVIGIMPDQEGFCWLMTFNGVNIIDHNFDVVRQLYDHQGLSHREFNSKAIAINEQGKIYAGTLNGVTGFDPKKVLNWKETNGFVVKAVLGLENNTSKSIEPNESGEYSFYNTVDSLKLSYSRPDYYSYPFIADQTKSYLLDSTTVNIEKTTYGLLAKDFKPGTFSVQLADEVTGLDRQLSFDVKRDYSFLLYLLSGLLLLVALSSFIIWYNRKKITEKSQLNERIAELRLTSLQSQMNPHFIFNALGAIQFFIQTHDAEKADEYLSNFAMLMRRILESSKSKYINLANEIDLLQLYIGLEAIRFENKFDYEIVVDDELDMDINVPPMIIQPYVENAINHGIYNLVDRKGKLTIAFAQVNEQTISCTVIDNGVGREKGEQLRTKRHKSRGMEIVKDRVATINTARDLKVDISVEDIVAGMEVVGTKAVITIEEQT